jgi:Zn finger protein HypA/HybF involved in hydrogenase expression
MQSPGDLLQWKRGVLLHLELIAMPVKVRCSACEKVLNAPDRARGKAIKCPACGSAVRVPIAKPTKKVAAPPPSSSMMIANLDLDRIEDTETRICPKCGVEVTAEDIECPECHVNLQTGVLSDQKKIELSRKGPNPKLFYKEFVRDGFDFWKREKRLSFRLAMFWTLFCLIFAACGFMSMWCIKPLLRDFWMFLGTISLLIPPGLTWNLHTTIIDATMRKKKKLGKYTYDKFLGAALGLKLIFWFLDIAAPVHIAAVVFLVLGVRGMPLGFIVAGALEVAAVLFASLLFPVAMTHMSMPITRRGWMLNKLSKPFFRTFPAVVYWCFFLYLTLLPVIACVAVGGYFAARGIPELLDHAAVNTQIFVAKAEIENIPKGKDVPHELQDAAKATVMPMNWTPYFVASGMLVAAGALFGLTAVFSMRTNGQYGRYFMDRIDLETMVDEIVYVPKARNLEEFEAKASELSWKPILMGIGLMYAVAILLGGSIGLSFLTGAPEGVTYGLLITGPILTLVGFGWVIVAAATGRKKENSPLKFAAGVLLSGLIAAGIGAALYATVDFKSGPAGPSGNAGQAQPAPGAAPKRGGKAK